jgi:20S proteasome alpha/beta subunit
MILPKPLRPVDLRASRPRRGSVTVATGFVYEDGLVFCADTKVTGDVKENESKLPFFPLWDGRGAMLFAISSDDIYYPKAAILRCVEMVGKMSFDTVTMDSMRNMAEFSLAEFYKEHLYGHPDHAPMQIYMQMLVGLWLRNETRLYSLHETVFSRIEEHDCIGAGEYLSKYLIKRYKRAIPGRLGLVDVTLLADFCVREAIEYDERCGGESEIVVMRNSGAVDSSYRTGMYPNYDFPMTLQDEGWKLIHDLGEAQMRGEARREAPGIVSEFCDRVREAEVESRRWGSGNFSERPEE